MELRLAGASTLEEANAVLADFLPRFNARFGVLAAQPGAAYQCVPAGTDLAGILCFKYQRTVAADNTMGFEGRTLQILARPPSGQLCPGTRRSPTTARRRAYRHLPRTCPPLTGRCPRYHFSPCPEPARNGNQDTPRGMRPSAPRLYLENQPPTTSGEGPSNHPPGQIH